MITPVIFAQLLLTYVDTHDVCVGGSWFRELVHAHISRRGVGWGGEAVGEGRGLRRGEGGSR